MLDVYCFIGSAIICGLYVWTHHWLTNNIIGILFCTFAIRNIFLGNFKVGMGLLVALFFYDIFWVFGTDVMVTVAKNIDGPIKLLFPKQPIISDPTKDLSLLGLGDIVIPGIFVSLCLRYDFLRFWKNSECDRSEKSVTEKFDECPKPYFWACMVGYLLAILTTVVIMIVFKHGQPALLYLVPGCCGAVLLTAFMRKELTELWNYDESKEIEAIVEESKELAKDKKE